MTLRKMLNWTPLLLILLITGCSELSRWRHFYSAAQQADKNGEFELADELYTKAVEDARTFGVPANTYIPALIERAQKSHSPAAWKDAVQTVINSDAKLYVVDAYTGLVSSLDYSGKSSEALAAAKAFADYSGTTFGTSSVEYAVALYEQCFVLANAGRGREALPMLSSAKRILDANDFLDKNDLMIGLAEVEADVQDQIGDRKAAIKAFSEASALASGTVAERDIHARFSRLLHKYGMESEAHQQYKAYLQKPDESPVLPRPLPTYQEFQRARP